MGRPIAVSGSGRDAHRQVVRFIESAFREWGLDVRSARQQADNEQEIF